MRLFFILLYAVIGLARSLACTSVIVSAKASKDGRPMIFKNRDTGSLNNICIQKQGTKYLYIGIANAGDTIPHEIWGGHNEKGFAIINTANYNLNKKDEKEEYEGVIMRIALGECATLEDFENMLDKRQRPLCVNTNFGVMDAQGGCAYYEVGNDGYVKYDANDSVIAPHGYLLRTNFGFSGDQNKNEGSERFMAITEFMQKAETKQMMEPAYLVTNIPRYTRHGMTHISLHDYMPSSLNDTTMMPFRDFIPRYSTASCILVQGVRSGENPCFTTSWMYVGYPLTTVCVPIIINPWGKLPKTFLPQADGKSWLATKGLQLKQRLFPYTVSNGKDYINVAHLFNKEGTGIVQEIKPFEDTVITRGKETIAKMRSRNTLTTDLCKYYDWFDSFIQDNFNQL